MKKLILLAIGISLSLAMQAQIPQGFNYQAVIRSSDGQLISEQAVTMRLTLEEQGGGIHYAELHFLTTTAQGIVNLVVGSGIPIQNNFADIPWAEGLIQLKVEVDPAGGSNFSILGISQLQSVPYALHAQSASQFVPDPDAGADEPLFVVRNSQGLIVFAVYEQGVRVYVDGDPTDEVKGNKSGFAIGGLTGFKETGEDYFRVSRGFTHVLFDTEAKGNKSGFAIGGLTGLKDQGNDTFGNKSFGRKNTAGYMSITTENYFIGHDAGLNTTPGTGDAGRYNSFFGYESGKTNSSGYFNTFMGYKTGHSNSTGLSNVFIGYNSGYTNSTGSNNVMLGNLAGYSGTNVSSNVFIGDSAGYGNTNSFNVFLGKGTGRVNTGQYNSFMGHQAGRKNLAGSNNVFIGNRSGYSNTTGSNNVFMGYQTGFWNIGGTSPAGSFNTFIGSEAGLYNSSGSKNVYVGYYAGLGVTSPKSTGTTNVFIGNEAGRNITSGSSNVIIGNKAGFSNTIGLQNVFLGFEAGYYNQGTAYNVFIGYQSGYSNIGGTGIQGYYNTFVGYQSGLGNVTGYYNTLMGYQAGFNNYSGFGNIMIGYKAGFSTYDGSRNVFVGHSAGESNDDGYSNVFLGHYTGGANTSGHGNTFLGENSGQSSTEGNDNVFVGTLAGYSNTTGSNNTYIGSYAGTNLRGNNNIAIGYSAGNSSLYIVNDMLYIDNYSGNSSTTYIYGSMNPSNRYIRFNSYVGINNSYGTAYGLIINGGSSTSYSVYAYKGGLTNGNWVSGSDERFKKDIFELGPVIEKIRRINAVNFSWRVEEFPDMQFSHAKQIGFIAQEVEKEFPELVITEEDGYKGIAYGKFSAVLLAAIKEQQDIIEAQNLRIETQEKQLETLKSELEAIKAIIGK